MDEVVSKYCAEPAVTIVHQSDFKNIFIAKQKIRYHEIAFAGVLCSCHLLLVNFVLPRCQLF